MSAICGLCGEPMPDGEEAFAYHGFSGPCPVTSQQHDNAGDVSVRLRAEVEALRSMKRCVVTGCGMYDGGDTKHLRARVAELEAEVEALRDKAIRFDLDAIGIASRERSDVELVELRAEVAALRAARQRVVLTVEEIADLARVTGDSEPHERYGIEPAVPEGILDEDTGVTTRHRFVAYLDEYPEEGVWPLGPPLEDQSSE